ncbi:TetR/AcrR family transcriptional regulator [Mumia sp. Pv 4-285]|uniref:SACE_7040 family transcriptional regulator n=1 Tax=Mumia qirimensis TaxID=3234852 RepID=UPI00351D9AE1
MATTRQEQILTTAASLFAERGFHGVSVHDIGAACGVSGPALYRHFAGKDAILSEMLIGISHTLRSGGRTRVDEATDAKEALDALVAFHIDFALSNPALIVVQEREWTNLDEASQESVRELQLDYVDTWVTALRSLRPELDQRTARAAVQATFGLLNSTPHSARISTDAMAELLTQMARRALLG